MKKLLLLLIVVLFTSLKTYSQVFMSNKESRIGFIVGKNYSPKDYVSVGYESGNIETQGDTIKAIKHLVAFIKQLQDESEKRYECIDASAKWSNTVSDYFKNNISYKLYVSELKKQGYKVNIKKYKQ